MKKRNLFVSAAMSGLLIAAGCSNSNVGPQTVGKCHGVNGCGGKGQCATKSNSCHGKNSCKAQGFVKMSSSECDKLGGKFES